MMKTNLCLALLFSFKVFAKDHDGVTLFPRLPVSATLSENSVCTNDSVVYVAELNNMTMWAVKSKYVFLKRLKNKMQLVVKLKILALRKLVY